MFCFFNDIVKKKNNKISVIHVNGALVETVNRYYHFLTKKYLITISIECCTSK